MAKRITVISGGRTGVERAALLAAEAGSADALRIVAGWLDGVAPRTLNVAGPSEARCPGIEARARALLVAVFSGARPAGEEARSR